MKQFILFFKKFTFGKAMFTLAAPLITMILGMETLIIVLGILISIDVITGVAKAFHTRKKLPLEKRKKWHRVIESSLLRESGKKVTEYGLLIIVLGLIDYALLGGATMITLAAKTFSLTELGIIFPIGIEAWSIWENMEEMGFTNLFKKLVKILPTNMQKIFNKDYKETEIIEDHEINE